MGLGDGSSIGDAGLDGLDIGDRLSAASPRGVDDPDPEYLSSESSSSRWILEDSCRIRSSMRLMMVVETGTSDRVLVELNSKEFEGPPPSVNGEATRTVVSASIDKSSVPLASDNGRPSPEGELKLSWPIGQEA
jgi:hypothetical protein